MDRNEEDHRGRPYSDAEYAGQKATHDIRTLGPIVGRLHPKVARLVLK